MTMAINETRLTADPGVQEVAITRTFNAPAERVFRAYVDAASIAQWWGPRSTVTIVDELDARPGGKWRFLNNEKEGPNEAAFHGVFHDVVLNERIVQTFEYEGTPGHVSLDTATFEEKDGRTTLSLISVFQSVADRDAMIEAGMEGGMRESMDRLAELTEG
jgi:uncharacterized protein YndB with AHSA1/START domain